MNYIFVKVMVTYYVIVSYFISIKDLKEVFNYV